MVALQVQLHRLKHARRRSCGAVVNSTKHKCMYQVSYTSERPAQVKAQRKLPNGANTIRVKRVALQGGGGRWGIKHPLPPLAPNPNPLLNSLFTKQMRKPTVNMIVRQHSEDVDAPMHNGIFRVPCRR